MIVRFWFKDPRLQGRETVMMADLPTIPEKREIVVFELPYSGRDPLRLHLKVRRRTWLVRQAPLSHAVEAEADIYCVERMEDGE